MSVWLHIECGSVFTGRVPPINCEICWGGKGWRQVSYESRRPGELRYRRKNKNRNGVLRALIERDGGSCAECGASDDLTIDHIRPRSKGGTNALSNLQILCYDCNQRKADTWTGLMA